MANEIVKIQCGYEIDCKSTSCLKCRRFVYLCGHKITLAEAIAIEDFATVDLDAWVKRTAWVNGLAFTQRNKYGIKQRDLEQLVMLKLMKRITWEKKNNTFQNLYNWWHGNL
jgi:hypothetical protein